jgi:LysM repeat protein
MKLSRLLVVLFLCLLLVLPAFAQEGQDGTHVVQSGENLFRIALRYGIDMNELAAANNITDPAQIYAGQVLIIPNLSAPDAGDEIVNPLVATAPVIHVVQRGEYIGSIARTYSVSVADILQANNLANPDLVYAGQELQIWPADLSVAQTEEPVVEAAPVEAVVEAAPVEPVVEAAPVETVSHTVMAGEHLASIAQRYGVSWTSIAEANGIFDPNTIYAGQVLTIPNGDPAAAQAVYIPQADPNLPDAGAHWGVGREIVVDLSSQMTYAYQDGALQFSALVSTGLPATPTVQGEYAIWHKTEAQTMSGPGYFLPNVQWVMYFYQGYGFHGTYWHNNFGNPMSHGCVNMTNDDALWLYNFASVGTNVWVQW